jgi:hypothetical protein
MIYPSPRVKYNTVPPRGNQPNQLQRRWTRKALRAMFNGEVFLGDSGMLPPSIHHPSIQTSLEQKNRETSTRTLDIQPWLALHKVAMVGSRGAGATNGRHEQSVSQILSNIGHHSNICIASAEQPAQAQTSANRRSGRLSRNPPAS